MNLAWYCGRLALSLVGVALAGTNIASAATFTYSSYSVVNQINVTIGAGNGNPAPPAGFEYGYFGSGQIILDGSGLNAGQTLDVWCIDATHDLQGSDTYQIVYPSTNNGGTGGPNSALSNPVLGEIGALVNWGDAHIDENNLISAAVQLAIWTIEYPGETFTSDNPSLNGSGGLVQMLVTDAQTGASGFAPFYDLAEVVNPLNPNGNQGLIYDPTPLPATWTMLIAGFASLGYFAYRGTKNRSASAAA